MRENEGENDAETVRGTPKKERVRKLSLKDVGSCLMTNRRKNILGGEGSKDPHGKVLLAGLKR